MRSIMPVLKALLALFLLPGTLLLNAINITVEDDGGILRSLINMLFWGFVAVIVTLPFVIK